MMAITTRPPSTASTSWSASTRMSGPSSDAMFALFMALHSVSTRWKTGRSRRRAHGRHGRHVQADQYRDDGDDDAAVHSVHLLVGQHAHVRAELGHSIWIAHGVFPLTLYACGSAKPAARFTALLPR